MVLWKLLHYAAYAFALTNRCQTYSHWCLARILISGGVPELRPDTAHWAFAGQPHGNSCPKERSLPLVLRRFVPTAPGGGAQQHRRKSPFGGCEGGLRVRGKPLSQRMALTAPASSQAPYPSFSPKGEKLGHSAAPPSPTEPSSAAVSSFAALRMRHTPCGYLRWASAGTPMRD